MGWASATPKMTNIIAAPIAKSGPTFRKGKRRSYILQSIARTRQKDAVMKDTMMGSARLRVIEIAATASGTPKMKRLHHVNL